MKIAEAFVEIRAESNKAEQDVRKRADSLGKTFAQVFGAAAFTAGINESIKAGSRLEQAVGATEAVFGSSAASINKWAQGADRAFGLSEAAAREALSLIGSQLKNFGFDIDEASEKGQELVGVASDLAATFGGSTSDAIDAISAALRGEFDTIEKYAVSLNEARIKAKALELGLYSGKGALDANAKAQAVLALVVEQTSAAHGQFARELDTVAGKQAVAAAQAENSAASLGQNLAPVYERIVELVGFLAEGFGALPAPLQYATVGLAGVVALAGPVGNLKDMVTGAVEAVKKMGTAGKASVGALGALGLVLTVAALAYGEYEEGKARAAARTRDFVDALKAEAAGQKNATTQMIASKLATKEVAKLMDDFGVSAQEVADWIQGKSVPAIDQLVGAYGSLGPAMVGPGNDIGATMRGFEITRRNASLLSMELLGLKGSFVEANNEFALQAELAAALGVETDSAALSARNFASASDDATVAVALTKKSFDDAATAANDLKAAIDAVFSPYTDLEEASRAYRDEAAALTAALDENGATLDINTEKGRANRAQVQAGVDAALAYAVAMVASGESTEDAANGLKLMTDGLIGQMHAAGLTEQEIAAYLETLGLTPENVETTLELADYDRRKRELEAMIEQLGTIEEGANADIRADIEQGKFDEAEAKIKELARTRNIDLNLNVNGNGGTFRLIRNAVGGYKGSPEVGLYGESGPEAILPLTNETRMAELMRDPRIAGPIAAAGGGGGGGGGGPVQIIVYGAERQYVTDIARRIEQIKAGG